MMIIIKALLLVMVPAAAYAQVTDDMIFQRDYLLQQLGEAMGHESRLLMQLNALKANQSQAQAQAYTSWGALSDLVYYDNMVHNVTVQYAQAANVTANLTTYYNRALHDIQVAREAAAAPVVQAPAPAVISLNETVPTINKTNWDYSKKIIYVEISTDCTTWECPDYRDIWYLDNSHITTGAWGGDHRLPTKYTKWWHYYNVDTDYYVIVEPPADRPDRNVITIQKKVPVATLTLTPQRNHTVQPMDVMNEKSPVCGVDLCRDLGVTWEDWTAANRGVTTKAHVPYQDVITRQIIMVFDGRVILDCNRVFIEGAKWQTLLEDTITFMRNGCNLDYTDHELIPFTDHATHTFIPADSITWHRQQSWIDAAAACKQKC